MKSLSKWLSFVLAAMMLLTMCVNLAAAEENSTSAIDAIVANTFVNDQGQSVRSFDITFAADVDTAALTASNFSVEDAYVHIMVDQKSYGVYAVAVNEDGSVTATVEPFLYYQRGNWVVRVKVDDTEIASFSREDVDSVTCEVADDFVPYVSDEGMVYSLYTPELTEGEKAPLILATHGGGETGTDNRLQLVANRMNLKWAEPETQARHKAFVLAAQAPSDWDETNYSNLRKIIDKLLAENDQIDANRIYVSEFYPRQEISFSLRNADIVAACIAMGGFETADADLTPVKDVAFYVVDSEGGNGTLYDVADRLAAVGNNKTEVKLYDVYLNGELKMFGGLSHWVWVPMLHDLELEDWLFAQSK